MRVTAVSLLAIFKLAPNKSRDQEVTYVSIVSMNQFCFLLIFSGYYLNFRGRHICRPLKFR